MKRRPRRIEQKVAEQLSAFYFTRGWRPVERIPVIGRTGPDIDIKESGLVIDVKSRKEVPQSAFFPYHEIVSFGDGELIGVRLEDIGLLWTDAQPQHGRQVTKTVMDYWLHLDEWRIKHRPEGVTCIILHRPGRPVKATTVVIHSLQRSLLNGKTNND